MRPHITEKDYQKAIPVTTVQRELTRILREAGYRVTQPRLAVLQVMVDHDAGLSPEEIHRLGQALCPSLGLVTVYRTLELFGEMNLVQRLHSEKHCHAYASGGGDRHHLICQRCHRVTAFDCDGLEGLIARVHRQTGYAISEHLLELSGLCPECQAAQQN